MAREIIYNTFEISLVVFMPNITTNHAITYTYQNSLISLPYPKLACLKSPPHHSGTYMYLYSPYIAVPLAPYGDQPHQHLCSLIIPHLQEDTFFLPCLDCCDV